MTCWVPRTITLLYLLVRNSLHLWLTFHHNHL
uniref:Uncharacterized protein n=2 Tax=unclassified Caudoviricetes TaxID=2788787 RepID=A0A8S5VBE1_9CAUD|nr:MAG TPA: hypothetical protein [Siphoviridae sp. ctfrT39]DAG03919.1 MAG TPA: hypothetical protein [Siphoviridae sp. ct0vA12]